MKSNVCGLLAATAEILGDDQASPAADTRNATPAPDDRAFYISRSYFPIHPPCRRTSPPLVPPVVPGNGRERHGAGDSQGGRASDWTGGPTLGRLRAGGRRWAQRCHAERPRAPARARARAIGRVDGRCLPCAPASPPPPPLALRSSYSALRSTC
jgi:hypothetical protein